MSVWVTKVVEYHHNDHQDGVTDRQDVEGCPPHILGFDVEFQVAFEPRPVMVVVEELVYDQEGGPVRAVAVDQEGEAAELPVIILQGVPN